MSPAVAVKQLVLPVMQTCSLPSTTQLLLLKPAQLAVPISGVRLMS